LLLKVMCGEGSLGGVLAEEALAHLDLFLSEWEGV